MPAPVMASVRLTPYCSPLLRTPPLDSGLLRRCPRRDLFTLVTDFCQQLVLLLLEALDRPLLFLVTRDLSFKLAHLGLDLGW